MKSTINSKATSIQGVSEKPQPIYNLKSWKITKFEYMQCIPFESTVFLLLNYMQFGYLNGIIYHLIYILVSLPNFKRSVLQKKNQPPFSGKIMKKLFQGISGLEALDVRP